MTDVAAPAAPAVPRRLDQALLVLLTALLVSLMTSITAVGIVTGLIIFVSLLRLCDPAVRERDRAPLAWPLLAFVVVTLLAALYAPLPVGAFYESKQLIGIALFLGAVNGFRSGDDIRRALRWFFVVVALVSIHALVQVWACVSDVGLPAWVPWALRVKLDACRESPLFRAKGFFSIYMTLGGSLLIGLTLILATFAVGARAGRLLQAASGVLAVVALALTYVRSAWVGLGLSLLVVSGLARRFVLLLVLVAATAAVLAVPSPVQKRALSIVDPTDPTARERFLFWDAGRRMVEDAPLLGLGPGGVKHHYPQYRDPSARRPATGHLHNNVVQIAAERGLIGLAAWLAIWVAFFVQAGRIYARLPATRLDDRALVAGSLAAVAGFHAAGMFEYNFGDSEVIGLVWVVMAFPFVVDPGPDALPSDEE
jgi:putative inorganic carbon (HCO3(-)) transporter